MTLNNLLPKNVKTAVLTQIERISQPISDFIRGNPIVSTAAVGIGTTGLITGVASVVRRVRKKKKTAKRKSRKRKTVRKRTAKRKTKKRKTKKWYGKTKGKKIKHTKNGQPYVILKSGKARFIKKSRSSSMKKRKGGYS